MTTRQGGVSQPPYESFNLGGHVKDDPKRVAQNRDLLRKYLPTEPFWLDQVHGRAVIRVEANNGNTRADAAYTRQTSRVCVVMTADCLPVLLCDDLGHVVAAAHAGWRGLAAGVLEATVEAMQIPPRRLMAWMGAAIGPQAFEVGNEVRDTFMNDLPAASAAFKPGKQPGKWWADIYQLARLRLERAGVPRIFGGGLCTYTDSERFFSYRRDGETGRMASLIWLDR
jgi:YfiH family protein